MPMRPSSELMASVMWVLMRSAMSMPVMMGIINTHGVMLNEDCRASTISRELVELVVVENSPTPAYMSSARIIAGEDVSIRYFMCVKSSTLHDEDARTVVSDSGDTLSPK